MAPLKEAELDINPTAMVVGGGIAGMAAARKFGPNRATKPTSSRKATAWAARPSTSSAPPGRRRPDPKLAEMIASVEATTSASTSTSTRNSSNVDGFVGNFTSTLSSNGRKSPARARGGGAGHRRHPLTGRRNTAYGTDPRIITSLDLDRRLLAADPVLKTLNGAVFIQCVGSREPERPYCSRVCCTHSVDNAIHLKEKTRR
jgi:heterodisulfide reductase subunit A2